MLPAEFIKQTNWLRRDRLQTFLNDSFTWSYSFVATFIGNFCDFGGIVPLFDKVLSFLKKVPSAFFLDETPYSLNFKRIGIVTMISGSYFYF